MADPFTEYMDNITKPIWHIHSEQHSWIGVAPSGEFTYMTNETAMALTVGQLIFAGCSSDNKVEMIKLKTGVILVLPRNGASYSEAAQWHGHGSLAKIFEEYGL